MSLLTSNPNGLPFTSIIITTCDCGFTNLAMQQHTKTTHPDPEMIMKHLNRTVCYSCYMANPCHPKAVSNITNKPLHI